MKDILYFFGKHRKDTGVVAPVASGIKAPRSHGNQCQCDCYECAGGDTSED